ncbi:MAG: hypothetical protein J5687_05385 [Treponema sp.]|nr:hypothetical protein [Treponema sp.]
MKRHFFRTLSLIFTVTALLVFCAGCTSEITLELKKDGSVDVVFSGEAGDAFAAMLGASDSVIFDTKEIEYEMGSHGFSKVKAVSKKGTDLTVSMTDKKGKSAMFTSGVISVENGKLNAQLSPQTLVKFYNSADSQTVQFLDMLLAPIFNDEKMSQEEYLEVIEAFYGEDIAEEMKSSKFRITLKNPDGSQTVQTVPFVKLLTLDEIISFLKISSF